MPQSSTISLLSNSISSSASPLSSGFLNRFASIGCSGGRSPKVSDPTATRRDSAMPALKGTFLSSAAVRRAYICTGSYPILPPKPTSTVVVAQVQRERLDPLTTRGLLVAALKAPSGRPLQSHASSNSSASVAYVRLGSMGTWPDAHLTLGRLRRHAKRYVVSYAYHARARARKHTHAHSKE